MSETVITVQGTAFEWVEAERGVVEVRVAHEGPEREPVYAATTRVAEQLTAALRELEGDAVTRWSSDRVSVWSTRPWNSEGRQLPLVHHAAVTATARFRDTEALASFVDDFATVDGVTISSIAWDLTEERRLAVTAEVRERAVRDAAEKAATYARAAGLAVVEPLAIADPGMLGDGAAGGMGAGPVMMAAKARGMMESADGPVLALTPDRIEVAATVDARFRAR